jgi:hypothetical protein
VIRIIFYIHTQSKKLMLTDKAENKGSTNTSTITWNNDLP